MMPLRQAARVSEQIVAEGGGAFADATKTEAITERLGEQPERSRRFNNIPRDGIESPKRLTVRRDVYPHCTE